MTSEIERLIQTELAEIRKDVRSLRDWVQRHQSQVDTERQSFERSIKILSALLLAVVAFAAIGPKIVLAAL